LYTSFLSHDVCIILTHIDADCGGYFIWSCASCGFWDRYIPSTFDCYLFNLVFRSKWCHFKKEKENRDCHSKNRRCVTNHYWYIGHTYLLVIEVDRGVVW